MEPLNAQFEECLSTRLRIDVDAAAEAHKEVRKVLEGDATLSKWGVDTILIGSYARAVSIYPCNDVDVFTKLPDCTETSPEVVFTAIQKPLVAHYKSRAQEQRRSMTVTGFGGGLSVDAVPAVRDGGEWKIPETDSARAKNRWEKTNPERLTQLTQDRNAGSPQVNGRGSYVPVVKLIRQVREHHLGDKAPGGLYFEFLAYWAFTSGISGVSYAELLATTLDRVARQLESGATAIDPVLGTPFGPAPEVSAVGHAAKTFRALATDAQTALGLEKCPAAAAWRKILGRNPRGSVFPLPAGCDESGKVKSAIVVNRDRGSDEARPFA